MAAQNAAGWSPPGPASAYARLHAANPPPRPAAPFWAAASPGAAQGTATLRGPAWRLVVFCL